MTSAPMSASIIPQMGPDMMWASSMTRIPASGPLLCVSVSSISTSLEFRFDLVEEGLITGTKVFRTEAGETFVAFLGCERRRVQRALDELLMPACDQRRAVSNPVRRSKRFGGDLIVGHDARNQPFGKRLLRPENAPFQQNFERDGGARELHERIEFRMRHHEAEDLDGHDKAAGSDQRAG